MDLGAWANEEYRVPAENSSPDDLDQGDQGGEFTRH
ncbi:MAG TPA: DNA gyrase inhibitor YacG [Marinobacter sp.]|nr:DNA gyrase inhibitor YacG [Marinobacter sp.]